MRLYFLRHAEALGGLDDAARPLSERGEQQAREMARFFKEAMIEFEAAYSSPLVRARATAEIVLEHAPTASGLKLEIVDALLNETSQARFDQWLKGLSEAKHALLVGHAPSLPERVRHLLGLTRAETLDLPKAGVACVRLAPHKTPALKFLVTPKALGL